MDPLTVVEYHPMFGPDLGMDEIPEGPVLRSDVEKSARPEIRRAVLGVILMDAYPALLTYN